MRSAYIESPSARLHYRESGFGAPLLLLHPTPYSSRYFLDLAPHLSSWRVLAPDLPGCGESDPLAIEPTMEVLARSLVSFMDALGIERAHVLGVHGGNKVGAALAARWPARVDRFVFIGMTHSIILDQTARNAELREGARRGRERAEEAAVAIDTGWTASGVGAGDPAEGAVRTPQAARRARRHADEALDRTQSARLLDALYRANLSFDLAAALACVQAPTLIVELIDAEENHLGRQAGRIAAVLADCRTLTLPYTDRALVHEHPDLLAQHVGDFLSEGAAAR